MQLNRYLIKFYYIASKRYFGSQRQKDYRTIEECILNALIKTDYITSSENAKFETASRTDRFVSARGAALSFISLKKPILMEINSALPREIGFWAYAFVSPDFFSRFNALYRHYKYLLPITKKGEYKDRKLNFKLLKRACKAFQGHHDFHNFYKQGNKEVKTSRDILEALVRRESNYLIFDFKSKAFLRQQIRRMVSKILEVGAGIIDYKQFLELFNPNVDISYTPADPRGLILWDICYPDRVEFIFDSKSIERRNKYCSEQEYNYKLKYKLFNIIQHNNIC